jgi:hypothetical protein
MGFLNRKPDEINAEHQYLLLLSLVGYRTKKKAASKVKIFVGLVQSIPVLKIGALKRCFINFYRELDVFKKHEYVRAFKILQIKPGETLRQFLTWSSKF